jgi:hypothetical protein
MKKIIKNILKEETDSSKLTLVKSLIYQLFDGVSFIEQSTYDNKPLLKVYFDSDDTAANIESWSGEEICNTIMEYSGNNIILCPYWVGNWDFRKKIADFYIDAELLKYDNLGNVINEDYIPTGKKMKSWIKSSPNRLEESKEKSKKDLIERVLNDLFLPQYEHVICGFEVKEPHERFDTLGNTRFQFISVTITFIGGKGTKLWPVTMGIRDMYDKVMDEVWDVIYNYTNEAVDVYYKTVKDCGKENIYLRESIDKSEEKKLKIVKDLIHTLFDEVSFIEIKKYGNKPMIRVYFDNDEKANNEEIYFAEQIQRKIYEYTGIKLIPYWHNIQYNTDADFRLDAIKRKYDNSGNDINESKEPKPKYLSLIKKLVEPFKYEEGVCDIDISYDDEDDMYTAYLAIDSGEMNKKFIYVPSLSNHISKLRENIKNTIKQYIPIDNLYVGSYGVPNCEWKSYVMTEKHKVSKDEYVELYRDNDFVLTIPLTHDASKKYGSDTKWCTTTRECDKKFNDHKKYGVLGYITVRDNELKRRLENNAFALYRLYGDNVNRTIVFDDQNNEYRNGEQWLSNKFDRFDKLSQFYKMLQKFNNYFESENISKEPILESKENERTDIKNVPSDIIPKIEKVLNKTMSNIYDWWKEIEIKSIKTSGKPFNVLTIDGTLKVDEEWGANQWRKYYDTLPFPGNDEGWEEIGYKDYVTLGDITGLKDSISKNLKEDITSVINMTTNLNVTGMQLATIDLIFI